MSISSRLFRHRLTDACAEQKSAKDELDARDVVASLPFELLFKPGREGYLIAPPRCRDDNLLKRRSRPGFTWYLTGDPDER